ncbi:TIGR00300 family protein [Desulfuromonas sp. TF]|uniref:ornithine cyclodeaminase n=1 Tax=Desulfuromonas sp. TF TaxID=1232410 RepID=UPI0003FDBAD1|nr:TIGR00300 family protein [Desulfuromonas sp. TF]
MDRDIRLYGHLIDNQVLSRVLDAISVAGATHEILSLRVGRTRQDASEAVLRIFAENARLMEKAVSLVREMGAELLDSAPAVCQTAPADGVLPERFYATTNLPTEVLVDKEWITVDGEEMDLAVVVSPERRSARGIPMAEVRKGELVVVGEQGVRVRTLPQESASPEFRFMASEVSAEKPKGPLLHRVLRTMRRVREEGKKILLVGGPAVVHTGAAPILEKLIHDGWVDILFAGNALAAHDIEQALLGTSLGVPVDSSSPLPAGHAHHLWAINAIRREGSIARAVESGLLKKGVMHACVSRGVPFVLAGSIRDDGPLPDVITDVLAAQQAMRRYVPAVGMAIMVGTTLHSVATGNLLPARVFTVCVDINPGAVTKLQDRGSRQSIGIVMDAASFLEQLAAGLKNE